MSEQTLNFPALGGRYEVSGEQAAAFQRDGHILLRALASADEIAVYGSAIREAALRRNTETRPLEERDTYGKAFLQIMNLWTHDEIVKRFVTSPRFARVASDLMGVDGVRLYHDQALFKEGGGGYTPLHTDQQFWPLDTENMVTMWMPLVNIPDEIGGLSFASGSHRTERLAGHGISDQSEDDLQEFIRDRGLNLVQTPGMKAGDATFHRGWTLHGAPANPSKDMRAVMTVIYFEDGARIAPITDFTRMDAMQWLPGAQEGEPAATELNPKLS
ncbi:MAG: phytanoyl-CoA dioxygenase family protein [Candidatus Dormibacteria bacterium]